MPIELKITGHDMATFYGEAMNAFLVLSKAQDLFKPVVNAAPTDVQTTSEPVGDVTKIDPPLADPPAPEKKQRKKAEPKVETPSAENKSDDPLGLDDAKPPANDPPLTLDEMRQRVKDIVARHAERGNEMPACIAYVRKLFEPFKIKLAADLKPEQFADFWSASEKYLDGTAK